MILPGPLAAVLLPLAPAFAAPTFERFVLLTLTALLTTGRRTVANLLRTLGPLAPGHPTSFQRVLSSARWSGLALLPQDEPVVLVGDDTVDGHPGKSVWGKARHRDPVRSSHGAGVDRPPWILTHWVPGGARRCACPTSCPR